MKKKSMAVNAFLNIVKQCCNILFPLITYPYISRVLGKASYGKYAFSNSVIAYFILFAMLGIDIYCIREGSRIREDKEKLQKFADEVTSINFISVIFTYLLLALFVIFNTKLNQYSFLLLIQSITIFSTFVGRDWINTVFEDFLYITIRYILIQIASLICIFLFVHKPQDYTIYTAIVTITTSLGFFFNYFYNRRYVKFHFTLDFQIQKHFLPILILFCSQLAISIYIQADITMIGFILTDAFVGVYALASKVYAILKNVGNAITTVMIPRIASAIGRDDKEEETNLYNNLANGLIMIEAPITIAVLFFARDIMYIMGGKTYMEGSATLQVLSFALLISIFSGFFCNAILVPHRLERAFLYITIVSAVINVSLNFIFIPWLNIVGAAITTLISETVVLFVAMYVAKPYYVLSLHKKDIYSLSVALVAVCGICWVLKQLMGVGIKRVGIAFIISVPIYFGILFVLQHSLVKEFRKKVKR